MKREAYLASQETRSSANDEPAGPSGSDSFNDAERALGRHNSGQFQPGCCKHRGEFLLGTLASSDDEHLNVEKFTPAWVVPGSDDVIDDEDFPFSFIEARQFERSVTQASSFQSWRMYFMM